MKSAVPVLPLNPKLADDFDDDAGDGFAELLAFAGPDAHLLRLRFGVGQSYAELGMTANVARLRVARSSNRSPEARPFPSRTNGNGGEPIALGIGPPVYGRGSGHPGGSSRQGHPQEKLAKGGAGPWAVRRQWHANEWRADDGVTITARGELAGGGGGAGGGVERVRYAGGWSSGILNSGFNYTSKQINKKTFSGSLPDNFCGLLVFKHFSCNRFPVLQCVPVRVSCSIIPCFQAVFTLFDGRFRAFA